MKIWYLHHYATPSSMAGMHRPFELGKFFQLEGNDLTVFSSSYLHFSDKNIIDNKKDKFIINNYDGIKTVFVKTCGYENSKIKRVFNMFQFYTNVIKVCMKLSKQGKPDIIIASSPHPLVMMAGLKIAKKLNVPCICEVRDFWPEVFFMGGVINEKGLIGKYLLRKERQIYEKSDALVFLKEGDHTYISEHKWGKKDGGRVDEGKCYYVNNGVDIEKFLERQSSETLDDEDLFNDKFTAVYCGAIRPVNNVGLLLDAAKYLDDDVQILIYGTGNCVEELKNRIIEEKINNVKIKGYVDNKYVPFILGKSSVSILNYSADKYNWSRGNSSNKMFEYLAAGRPVISTVKMGYDILERYSCGLSTEICDGESIANCINNIKNLEKSDYLKMCNNAKTAAQNFDMQLIAGKFLTVLNTVLDNKNRGDK